jgi:hypothetical protein
MPRSSEKMKMIFGRAFSGTETAGSPAQLPASKGTIDAALRGIRLFMGQ